MIASATVICSRAASDNGCAASHARPPSVNNSPRCGQAVVIQDRLDALLPLTALMRKRVPQPDLGAKIEQVIGRDPGLRQLSDRQQLTNMPRVSTIALGALLIPTPRGGLSRLGQVHRGTGPTQLIGHEPPAGRRLQRDLELQTTEPLTEPPDAPADAPA